MKTFTLALATAIAALSAPVGANAKAHKAVQVAQAAPATGKLSVTTTPVSDIIKNEKARAALEKAVPQISDFYDKILGLNLTEVAPISMGYIDTDKLKEIQAEFDKINASQASR